MEREVVDKEQGYCLLRRDKVFGQKVGTEISWGREGGKILQKLVLQSLLCGATTSGCYPEMQKRV